MAAPEIKESETTPGAGRLRLQYFRSSICAPEKHKRVVRGLGFTRLNQVVQREDTPSIRGMVGTVPHLVRILEESGR
ncbi:MAG: 50S ribosomal protein L30 [Stellaceae bacterium]